MAKCNQCGAMNDVASEFCQNCGASLLTTSLSPREQVEPQKVLLNKTLPPREQVAPQNGLLSKIEQSIYFRIARGFAWFLLVFSLLSFVGAGFIAVGTAREYFKGQETVSTDDVKVAIATSKANRTRGAEGQPTQETQLDPKAEGMLATEIAELFNLLSAEDQKTVGGKEQFRKSMLEMAAEVKGTNNAYEQIESIREVKKVVREFLPQSERLDAIKAFFGLKINSMKLAESRKAAARAELMYSGGAMFSAAAIITLLTMVLVLLAIDRNTRKA